MTVSVISIALALPATVLLIAQNLQTVADGFPATAKLSVFLEADFGEAQGRALAQRVQAIPEVERIEYISAAAAMAEFREMSGLGDALDRLPDNPLPSTLLVEPSAGVLVGGGADRLADRIRNLPGVDQVVVDAGWLEKLRTILRLTLTGGLALGLLMAVGVVLVISNTVRLSVVNRREEIEIIDLVGGTSAFIRMPFLYSGMLQGALGGLCAWALTWIVMRILSSQVTNVASQYGSDFTLGGPGWGWLLGLTSVAAGLGWAASRGTVSWQLSRQSIQKN